ncbi:MAG: hypothetical protein QM770_22190 [Tepidisphaeraceae bacterium]
MRIGNAGGTASITLTSGGQLLTPTLITGGIGSTVNFYINDTTASAVPIKVTGATTLTQGTTITLVNGDLDLFGGTLTMTGNARIVLENPTDSNAIGVKALAMGGTSKIDIGNGGIIISDPAATPLATLRSYILTGLNGGDWLGNGITSSYAASTPARTVGYGLFGTGAIVYITLPGDANGDHAVNFSDLLTLAANYSLSGKYWSDGDYNYDGTVNFADLLTLAANYGHSYTAGLEGVAFDGGFASAQVVPEPTATGLIALMIGPLAGKRRRSAVHAKMSSSGSVKPATTVPASSVCPCVTKLGTRLGR